MPRESTKASIYLVTLHKAASSFIRTVLAPMLADDLELKHVPVAEELLTRVDIAEPGAPFEWPEEGRLYSRLYPAQARRIDLTGKKWVALQRDPRDIAVSWYYSVRYSHPSFHGPGGKRLLQERKELTEVTPREGVRLMAERAINEFSALRALYRDCAGGLMTSYEEMVTAFPSWFDRVSSHLGVIVDVEKYYALQSEFVVEQEDPRRHKRRVTPGNWRTVFDASLRTYFTESIGPIMADAGYDP